MYWTYVENTNNMFSKGIALSWSLAKKMRLLFSLLSRGVAGTGFVRFSPVLHPLKIDVSKKT